MAAAHSAAAVPAEAFKLFRRTCRRKNKFLNCLIICTAPNPKPQPLSAAIGGKKDEDFSYKAVGSGVMDVGAGINAATAAGSEWIQ